MKMLLVYSLIISAAAGARAEQPKYTTFTDTQGRTIKARVLSVDEEAGKVKIERNDHRSITVPISLFSKKDQSYIHRQGQVLAASSKNLLRVSLTEKTEENERAAQEMSRKNSLVKFWAEDTSYEIELDNRSASTFDHLAIEYCIFYDDLGLDTAKSEVLSKKIGVKNILSNSKRTVITEPVTTYRSRLAGGYIYNDGTSTHKDGRVDGIWVRLYLQNGDQKGSLLREFSEPENLMDRQTWRTESTDDD